MKQPAVPRVRHHETGQMVVRRVRRPRYSGGARLLGTFMAVVGAAWFVMF
jgi:hypothetical protein